MLWEGSSRVPQPQSRSRAAGRKVFGGRVDADECWSGAPAQGRREDGLDLAVDHAEACIPRGNGPLQNGWEFEGLGQFLGSLGAV